MAFSPAIDIVGQPAALGPAFFSIGAGIGGEILGFIRAGYTFIGAWDVCPAATRVLKRRYGAPGVTIITDDVNKPFPLERLPIDECDVVTVALQCQCISLFSELKEFCLRRLF